MVPSLQVATQTAANGGGSATFFLRGLGQQRSGNGSEPAVGVYLDDIYYPSLQGTVFSILDLEQVEVLRGPQGTLFGRNTIGGAIRYQTQKPTDSFGGYLIATGGSYNRGDLVGGINLPVTDTLALRVSGGHLERDGFVSQQNGGDKVGGSTTNLGRVQLRWTPVPKLRVDVAAQYSEDKLDGFGYYLPGPVVAAPGGLPFVYNTTPPGRAAPFNNNFASTSFYSEPGTNLREFSDTKTVLVTSDISYELTNDIVLKSLTGYVRVDNTSYADIDSTPASIYNGFLRDHSHSQSQEFQLNGKFLDGHLNLVSGVFYYHDAQSTGGVSIVTLGRSAAPDADVRDTSSYAAYFDGSYKLTDKLSFLGGFRYSNDRKTAQDLTVAGDVLRAANRGTFESETGRAGVQYQWTPDIFTFSTGFRGGGFNRVAPTTTTLIYQPFQPEDLTSYELGARTAFLALGPRSTPPMVAGRPCRGAASSPPTPRTAWRGRPASQA